MCATLVSFLLILGMAGGALSQRAETRTSTLVTTLPATTVVSTVVLEGGVATVTLQIPGFVVIEYFDESGRSCTVVFRAKRELPETTVAFQGTTASFPGATFSTVINQATFVTSEVEESPGWTTTYRGAGPEVVVTMTFGPYVTTLKMSVFGELREACGPATIRRIMTIILERAPATVMMAFPGLTMTFPGFTYTLPGMTLEIEEFTTTYTSYISGETYTTTYTHTGSTGVMTMEQPATSYVTTIISPGRVLTTYVIYTTTITDETTPPTATETVTPTRTETTPTAPPPAQAEAPPPIDPLILAIVGAVIIVVVATAVYALRRRR